MCSAEGAEATSIEENAVYRHGKQFAEQLAQGLADNWSQVSAHLKHPVKNLLKKLNNTLETKLRDIQLETQRSNV